jgi:hypothetical protein
MPAESAEAMEARLFFLQQADSIPALVPADTNP